MTSESKRALLAQVEQLLSEADESIRSHPAETVAVYENGRKALEQGMVGAEDSDWLRSIGLTLEDQAVLTRYMLAMSFMSAWYHLHGDKQRRDKAAQSASTIIAGVGIEPEAVMRRFLKFEHTWRDAMKAEGIAPRNWGRLVFWIVVVVLILWWVLVVWSFVDISTRTTS